MTWHDSIAFLVKQSVASALEFASRGGGDLCEPIGDSTPVGEEEADEACLTFASDLRWPQTLSNHAMRECLARLKQAFDLAEFVVAEAEHISPNHAAVRLEIPDAHLLQWLLIDYWRMVGRSRAIFRCFSPHKPIA
ncbi:MAG: hypothetical protein AAB676_05255 [Verrucomicrobiota bacterium]